MTQMLWHSIKYVLVILHEIMIMIRAFRVYKDVLSSREMLLKKKTKKKLGLCRKASVKRLTKHHKAN